ncbi:AAA family ATPase [Rhizorhapis sp.]|uniref:AAA family ATPase n=1 Tax=Rhizorhapis sp. TaxID=1968842 RepID=UPI002B49039E|nr:AAA family ATPase [Rhizorhapis sp.]HKR16178.1 AAA family ATPase [Rhizorhapis sp.]
MRVHTLRLLDFKRFHDLTIDLTARSTKIVAIVGPNGTGKSSVFDAFEEVASVQKGRPGKLATYYQKSAHEGDEPPQAQYDYNQSILLKTDQGKLTRTSVYIRSAYRFTPRLEVGTIRKLPDAEKDENRPQYLIDTDTRLTENYERLIGRFFGEVYGKDVNGATWVEQNIEGINAVLREVLDIKISSLGNPVEGQGSLYFAKGTSRKFPYANLSAGEKEIVDLVLDLYVKKTIYTNSIICIDEPELHLNTAIQRRLLTELEKLVPDNSQLWVATHSIGFLRALQEDLSDQTTILDFGEIDFDAPQTVTPILGSRADWTRIFATALEDLTGLLAPKRIVYCEGRPEPNANGQEQGLDADIYNAVFQERHADTLFVSSGGGGEVSKNALIALRILGKAIKEVQLDLLKDRDELTDDERNQFLAESRSHRMLVRREIENYLFDKQVLQAFCLSRGIAFDEARYDSAVTDIRSQDLKPLQQEIQASCHFNGRVPDFKRALVSSIELGFAAYQELESSIFP